MLRLDLNIMATSIVWLFSAMTAPSNHRSSPGLSEFGEGTAQILALDLPEIVANRLKALGLFEGQLVTINKSTNPMIVTVFGSRVALAHEVARHIKVGSVDETL